MLKANTVAVLLNTVNSAGYDIFSSPRPQRGPRALVIFTMLHANEHFALLGPHATKPAVIAVFSFLSGYSERFIIGLHRIQSNPDPARSRGSKALICAVKPLRRARQGRGRRAGGS